MSGRTPRYSKSCATPKTWKVSAVSVNTRRSASVAGQGPSMTGEVTLQRSRTAYISPRQPRKSHKVTVMEEEFKEKKGVALKALGMMLILLSSLDLMFCWRGGFPVGILYPTILVAGIAMFAFGTLRGR